MIRKALIIGTVALGLAFSAAHNSAAIGRFVSSAQSFRHYFSEMKAASHSLSPIERFVFSLILANSSEAPTVSQCAALERRT